jgi:hypothetical protein
MSSFAVTPAEASTVSPAKAGIQGSRIRVQEALDPRLRGDDYYAELRA